MRLKPRKEQTHFSALLLRVWCSECDQVITLAWNFEYDEAKLYYCPRCKEHRKTHTTYRRGEPEGKSI